VVFPEIRQRLLLSLRSVWYFIFDFSFIRPFESLVLEKKMLILGPRPHRTLLACAFAATVVSSGTASAGVIGSAQFTNDADSGISDTNTYTHKIDFAESAPGTAAVVNGVTFDFFNKASDGSLNFSYNGGGDEDNNGTSSSSLSGGVAGLLQGFLHQNGSFAGLDKIQTWTLSGLDAGVEYELRIYAGRWSTGVDRRSTFTFDPDGAGAVSDVSVSINEDNPTALGLSAGDAFYLSYRYTAVTGEDLVVKSQINNSAGASWHVYALTNQVVPEPTSLALMGLGGMMLMRRRRA